MSMARRSFAKRLKALRIAAGYDTSREFCDEIGVKEGTYNRYERGETEPNFETLIRICQVLNTDPTFLLLGKIG